MCTRAKRAAAAGAWLALCLAGRPARAQQIDWADVGLFATGVATAFLAHEAGHATANFALGNTPHLERVTFAGAVPFFAVAPDISCSQSFCLQRDGSRFRTGQRGLLLILLAGFDVQHVTDEIVLTRDPSLRLQRAPFRTGLLAFNTLTSVAYAVANASGLEPDAGDLSDAFRDARAPRGWTTGLLFGIAALDVARWALPENTWLPGLSRAAKVAFLGMPFAL